MSTARRKAPTPAQRARAREDAALTAPPPRVMPRRNALEQLTLEAGGRDWLIGPAVEGETPWEMTTDGAATVSIPLRSPDERLMQILGDEAGVARNGVRLSIDGVVYALQSVNADGQGLFTLVFEDLAAWRLRQFSRFISATRATTTRAGFVRRMVAEASGPPREPLRAFIPEVRDLQPIAPGEGD